MSVLCSVQKNERRRGISLVAVKGEGTSSAEHYLQERRKGLLDSVLSVLGYALSDPSKRPDLLLFQFEEAVEHSQLAVFRRSSTLVHRSSSV